MLRTRWLGLAVAVPAWALLAVSAWLTPDPAGYDTHTQLGLSPCAMPQITGYPCPTCGMTTAFALMADGRVVQAFAAQAFGALLFVAVLAAAVMGAVQSVTGHDLLGRVRVRRWQIVVAVVLFFAAWAVKIAVTVHNG